MSSKVSQVLRSQLTELEPRARLDAIVIYRSEKPGSTLSEDVRSDSEARRRWVAGRRQSIRAAAETSALQYQAEVQRRLKSSTTNEFRIRGIGNHSLPIGMVEITRRTLSALEKDPTVAAILPNQRIHLIAPRAVNPVELEAIEQRAGATWGLQELGIPGLWEQTQGQGAKVGVLDTGVFGQHPALEGRVTDFVAIDPLGRRINATPSFDGGQHGTHVCGTIAGSTTPDGVAIGVAPRAQLAVAGVLLGEATLATLLEGISWTVAQGCEIISLSLGFTYYEPLFAEVFRMVVDEYDVLPVAAIGNENHGNTSCPGSVAHGIGVGAMERLPSGKHAIAPFSSGASLLFPGEKLNRVDKPDVAAPGVQVYSCIPPERTASGTREYAYMDGTSMATPHVAGVAALLRAAKPLASAREVMQALRDTAQHPRGSRRRPDNRWGWGAVSPADALKAL